MSSHLLSDAKIVESWKKNARPWTTAVRQRQIESRKQTTDQAIVDAVLSCSPSSILDIGCGEGWLARRLSTENIKAIGVDVVPELVEAAKLAGNGDFRIIAYEEIAAGKLHISVDAIVCNFSLLGKESVEGIFRVLPSLLTSKGVLVIQTLHPLIACGDEPYRDGWRQGSWVGFSEDFSDPAPWYFRTIESWIGLFTKYGVTLRGLREPLDPKSQRPASLILIGEVDG